MATEVAQLPHIEVFHRVLELPVVESAISKSAATYSRVKDWNQLVHWALTTAESSISSATKQAVPIAAPFAKKFESPIHFVDHKLCLGLDKIEEKVPLVKEKPEQILENAYTLARQTVQPAVTTITLVNELIIAQALSLRDMSWNKANQILDTHYGSAAVRGLDNTADVVEKMIDKYFPATGDEAIPEIPINEEDKLLHTLQTVGRLSNKAAHRVYSNIVLHLGTINADNFKAYVKHLVEFLRLTNHQAACEEVQAKKPKSSVTSKTGTKKKVN